MLHKFWKGRTVLPCLAAWMMIPMMGLAAGSVQGGDIYQNPDTGYRVVLEDDAQLLTKQERAELADIMKEITEYGNAAFKSIEDNDTSAGAFAASYFRANFGTDSGTLLLIDMDNRKLWIHSDGAVYRIITTAYAETVTDNIYRYASKEEYFTCASECFSQIAALLRGQKIARPMKYISNLLLALCLALLFNFWLMNCLTRTKKARQEELLGNIQRGFSCTKPTAVFINKTKVYDPVSSDSGSSGGSSGGGSSSGGSSSGSSGGGGGHSF